MDAVGASSARAMFAVAPAMHTIEFTFIDAQGGTFTVSMEHHVAAPFIEQAIAAYSAIQRPIQFPRNIPFSG